MRPDWDDYFFQVAGLVASRATCPRAAIGVLLVKNHRILSTGYNGAAAGEPHCPDSGDALLEHLALLHCPVALHAERNAVINAVGNIFGATAYVIGPRRVCLDCDALLHSVGVTDIRWRPSALTLDALARDIWPWARSTFPQATAQSWAKHLRKEARELDERPTSGEEMADIFHLLAGIAGVTGTDLAAEVARKFAINKARVWGEPDPETGVVEHVREAVR